MYVKLSTRSARGPIPSIHVTSTDHLYVRYLHRGPTCIRSVSFAASSNKLSFHSVAQQSKGQ